MEIVAYDATDGLSPNTPGVGDLPVTSIAHLASQLRLTAGAGAVTELHILDRGFRGGVQLGSDWVTKSSLPRFAADLEAVAEALAPDAIVHLHNCLLDDAHPVMREAARMLGCRLVASRGLQHPRLVRRLDPERGAKNPFGGFGRILARGYAV